MGFFNTFLLGPLLTKRAPNIDAIVDVNSSILEKIGPETAAIALDELLQPSVWDVEIVPSFVIAHHLAVFDDGGNRGDFRLPFALFHNE